METTKNGLRQTRSGSFLDERREARESQAARSLFLQEINDAIKTLEDGIEKTGWPLGWKPWVQTWESYRAAVAPRWSAATFTLVATAYADMYGLDHGLRDGHDADRSFKGDDQTFFTDALSNLRAARDALER